MYEFIPYSNLATRPLGQFWGNNHRIRMLGLNRILPPGDKTCASFSRSGSENWSVLDIRMIINFNGIASLSLLTYTWILMFVQIEQTLIGHHRFSLVLLSISKQSVGQTLTADTATLSLVRIIVHTWLLQLSALEGLYYSENLSIQLDIVYKSILTVSFTLQRKIMTELLGDTGVCRTMAFLFILVNSVLWFQPGRKWLSGYVESLCPARKSSDFHNQP